MLQILSYHYVRDPHPDHPHIHAIRPDDFRTSLLELGRTHTFVSMDEVAAGCAGAGWSGRRCLLTFDDGLRDHVDTVAPILDELGIPGAFFATSTAAEDADLLTTHQVQHLLGAGAPISTLVERIRSAGADDATFDRWWAAWAAPSRFDDEATMFVKRALQAGLPQPLRVELLDTLTDEFTPTPTEELAARVYCNVAELAALAARGHTIGAHGVRHVRLAEVDRVTLADELAGSASFLERHGFDRPWATICYPFGSVDATVLEAAPQYFGLGFTTATGPADPSMPLQLGRYDATELDRLVADSV